MKRLSAIIISAVMTLSVCACGGGATPAETTVAVETTSKPQIEYFTEDSSVPKPIGLVETYDKENNLYMYDLTEDVNESGKIIEGYKEQLEKSGFRIDKDKGEYLMYYILKEGESIPIGGFGLISDPNYGKHQMAVNFVKKSE